MVVITFVAPNRTRKISEIHRGLVADFAVRQSDSRGSPRSHKPHSVSKDGSEVESQVLGPRVVLAQGSKAMSKARGQRHAPACPGVPQRRARSARSGPDGACDGATCERDSLFLFSLIILFGRNALQRGLRKTLRGSSGSVEARSHSLHIMLARWTAYMYRAHGSE